MTILLKSSAGTIAVLVAICIQMFASDFSENQPTSNPDSPTALTSIQKSVKSTYSGISLREPQISSALLVDDQSWTRLSNIPTARFNSTVVQYRDDIFVFNGFGPGMKIQPVVEKFGAGTQEWSSISSTSVAKGNAVAHNGVIRNGNEVWIIGGRVGNHPGAVTSKVWIFNLTTEEWSEGPSLPVAVAAGGAALVENRIHWFGGLDARAQCDVDNHYVYDLDNPSDGWIDISGLAPMPNPRKHFATAVHDGLIYAIGGQSTHDGCIPGNTNTDLVHMFDPQSNIWTQLASLPTIQSHIEPSTFVHKDAIYVVGGAFSGNKVYRYDPSNDDWDTVAILPQALLAPVARVVDNNLVVSSGGAPGVTPTKNTYTTEMAPLLLPTVNGSNINVSSEKLANSEIASDSISEAGLILLEAEHYDTRSATTTHQWVAIGNTGASNNAAMTTTPDSNTLVNGSQGSPSMSYFAYFDRPGIWYFWVRGSGDTLNGEGKNDSLHAGLNDILSTTADNIDNFPSGWNWTSSTRDGIRASLNIPSAGIHVVNLWMREDELAIDKLLLTTDSNFQPTGIDATSADNGLPSDNEESSDNNIPIEKATTAFTITNSTQENWNGLAKNFSSEPNNSTTVRSIVDTPEINVSESWVQHQTSDGTTVSARHEAGGVELNGKLYVLGGRGMRNVSVFDPSNNSWEEKSSPPIELNHFQPVAWGNKIWVIGAFTGNFPNETSVAQIYTYTPSTDQWEIAGSIPAGRRRGSVGAVLHNDKIYLVGGNVNGHNAGAKAWFDSFDPQSSEWQILADAPSARDHATIAVSNNKLIVTAGRQSAFPNTFGNMLETTNVFDFATENWSTRENIPTQRAGTMTVSVGDEVIVIGGETAGENTARNTVEAYNVKSNTWRQLSALNTGRHGGAAAVINKKIHVISGSERLGGAPESVAHETLNIPSSINKTAQDLIALHYDVSPDLDDLQAIPSGANLSDHFNISPAVVIGTYGHVGLGGPQNEDLKYLYETATSTLGQGPDTGETRREKARLISDAAYGAGTYLDTGDGWSQAVNAQAEKFWAVLQNGGIVNIAEGGPMDFTADVLTRLQEYHGANSAQLKNVKIVQHALGFNAGKTLDKNLSTVEELATYVIIDNGNFDNNATADLEDRGTNTTTSDFAIWARNDNSQSAAWNLALDYFSGKVDFSDTVEYIYILDIPLSDISDVNSFADYFPEIIIDDTESPTTSITSPAANELLLPGNHMIAGTATDTGDSGVERVGVIIRRVDITPTQTWNGNAWVTESSILAANLQNNGNWDISDVDLTTAGRYRISVNARDNAGNVSTFLDNPTILLNIAP